MLEYPNYLHVQEKVMLESTSQLSLTRSISAMAGRSLKST